MRIAAVIGVPPVAVACAAGALLGVFYTLSPMTLWFGAAMAVLLVCAGRGLDPRERLWLFGILATAIALRLAAVAAFFAVTAPGDGSFPVLIPDEVYVSLRTRLQRWDALGVPLLTAEYLENRQRFGETAVHEVFAYVQILVGDAPYGIRLFNAGLYIAGAVMVYRLVRATFGAVAALVGLAAALFLPSLFIWSISTIKETTFNVLTMISFSAAAVTLRSGSSLLKRCGAFLTCAAGVLVVETVRAGGTAMLGGGILAGVLLLACVRRPLAVLRVSVLCAVVVAGAIQMPAVESRMNAALNRGDQQLRQAFTRAAFSHWGYISTAGWNYKVLDPEFYIRNETGSLMQPLTKWGNNFQYDAIARFVLRALTSFVLVPLPWQVPSNTILAYLPEQIVWYLLVVLALVGTLAGLRRDLLVTLLLAGVGAVGSAGIALTSGNIGTLARHRSMVLVVLVWLSGLGASVLLSQWAARRARTAAAGLGERNAACLS